MQAMRREVRETTAIISTKTRMDDEEREEVN